MTAFSKMPGLAALLVIGVFIGPERGAGQTFSDANWMSLGSGIAGSSPVSVNALAVSGTNLYVGGSFTMAGGSSATNIARWNGNAWAPLGSGMDNAVYALAVLGGTLYAGGPFGTAGGSPVNYIARWDGTNWSGVGSGMNDTVYALAVSGNTLYAGGYFTTAGGSPANYVAHWNGSSWSPLGSGMNDGVFALEVSGGTLYAGGYFTTAGGSAANCVARWDGNSWSPLGLGISGEVGPGPGGRPLVSALAVSGVTLYAGGSFTMAGGDSANDIAQWDGTSWSALGSGMNGFYGDYVSSLVVSGGWLYAGGYFTMPGGNPANFIAQWDGSDWSALGSGMNHAVGALALSGGMLYVGGAFTTAGTNAAAYVAGAVLSPAPILTQPHFAKQQFQFTVSGPAGSNAVIHANTNLASGTWIPFATNGLGLGSMSFADPVASNYPARFYRARVQ